MHFGMSLRQKAYFVVFIVIAYFANRHWRSPNIPIHLLNHQAKFIHEMLSVEEAQHLMDLTKEMADFPSNAQDLEFYKTTYEHIGEAQPINEDGTCSSIFLIPNKARTHCILPGRIDVARHFMKYGGVEGMKESFAVSSSRVQSFGRYYFDLEPYPGVKKLFESERFLSQAKETCPAHKQVLDPFQFNFIIQVPGQSVALHLDAVYFEDATRFQYPQWLLAVMQTSGLYKEKAIDQIQVVGYYHQWNTTRRGGQFIYYLTNDIKPYLEMPFSRAGSMVDGSKVIHAATIYQPKRTPPIMATSKNNRLIYKGDDKWEVTSDGKTMGKYSTDDLRMTIVFRARCFESEKKKKEFNDWYRSGKNVRPVEEILEDLKNDLVAKKGYEKDYVDNLKTLDLAFLLLDEYIAYPIPSKAFIPYNYCLLDRLFPWTAPLIKLIC